MKQLAHRKHDEFHIVDLVFIKLQPGLLYLCTHC